MATFKPYIRGLVLIALFVAAGFLARLSGLDSFMDESWVDREIRGQGLTGEAVFILVGAAFTAVGVPRQVVGFLGGYAFGVALGTGLALAASVLGCILAFFTARLLGREWVRRHFGGRIRRIDDFLHDNPFSMTLLVRLLPVGSNLLTTLAAAVSGVRALPFFAGSALGYLPQTAIFALLGSGIRLDPELRIGASAALFVASGMLGVYLFRRFRKSRALDATLDPAPGVEGRP